VEGEAEAGHLMGVAHLRGNTYIAFLGRGTMKPTKLQPTMAERPSFASLGQPSASRVHESQFLFRPAAGDDVFFPSEQNRDQFFMCQLAIGEHSGLRSRVVLAQVAALQSYHEAEHVPAPPPFRDFAAPYVFDSGQEAVHGARARPHIRFQKIRDNMSKICRGIALHGRPPTRMYLKVD